MSKKKKIALIIWGVFLALIFIEVAMRIGGFVLQKSQNYRNRIIARTAGEYYILCIGESTTLWKGEESYPRQLERILNARSKERKFKVINEGTTAANTTMILNNLNNNLGKHRPQMVVAMMGINDRYLDSKFIEINEFEKRPFFKNLRLYKFFRWRYAFAKSKISNSEQTNIKDPDEEEIITIEDMKDDIERARYLRETGEYEEAMALFRKETKINPRNCEAWVELWICYEDQRRSDEAEEFFRKQLKMYPENYTLHRLLGNCYRDQGKYKEAEAVYKRLIEDMNSRDSSSYIALGICYEQMREFSEEKTVYEKAVKKGVEDARIYKRLGDCYRKEENYEAAEKMYLRAMKLEPERDYFLGLLGGFYLVQGKYVEAEELFRKASKMREKSYNMVAWFNYLKLQKILKEKGIKLVCMQYPMRSARKLKGMFSDPDGIIFVDNEEIFKKALRISRYKELFDDSFAGDFGHCTSKGNRLIADNLANIILKELANEK